MNKQKNIKNLHNSQSFKLFSKINSFFQKQRFILFAVSNSEHKNLVKKSQGLCSLLLTVNKDFDTFFDQTSVFAVSNSKKIFEAILFLFLMFKITNQYNIYLYTYILIIYITNV